MNCLDCKHWESSPSDWTEPLPPRGAGREPDAARLLDLIGDIRRIVASSSWVREAVDNSMTCREADRWMGETRRVLEDAGRPVTRIDLEAPEPAPDKLREELADALFNIRDIILDDPKGLEWLREYMGPTTFNAWFDKTFDLLRRSGKLSPTS